MSIKTTAYKLLGSHYTALAYWRRNIVTKCYAIFHPYHYDGTRYAGSLLNEKAAYPYDDSNLQKVERVIYVFWTGDNEITPNRLKGIESLQRVSHVKVQLITPKNLPQYIKDDDPLPEAYQYLSLNHRSDFLRGYFMYHYGGGYADIKTYFKSWVPAFDKLDSSDAYALGYPEVGWVGVANSTVSNTNLKNDLAVNWSLLIGNGAFICRPHTRFTAEWYSASRSRLLEYTEKLRKHPTRDGYGTNADYPIEWTCLQGGIFHPYCLKYHDRLLKDKALMPSFKDYR